MPNPPDDKPDSFLLTPRATDGTAGPVTNCPSVVAICDGSANRTPRLSEMAAGGLLPKPKLLPTPQGSDGTGGKTSHPDTRRANNHSVNLPEVAIHELQEYDVADDSMLPTPKTTDHRIYGAPAELRRDNPSLGAVNYHFPPGPMLPTPKTTDYKINASPGEVSRHTPCLGAIEHYLPTPNVGAARVTNSPGEMDRKSPALGAVVADLADGSPMLPTPTSRDGDGGGVNPHADLSGRGTTKLRDFAKFLDRHDSMLPTPQARDFKSRTPEAMGKQLERGYGNDLPDVVSNLPEDGRLFPTSCAGDGTGGRGFGRNGTQINLKGIVRALDGGTDGLPDCDELKVLLPTPTGAGSAGNTSRSGDRINELLLGGIVKEMAPEVVVVPEEEEMTEPAPAPRWGKYEAAIRRWEGITRSAPNPTEPNTKGNPRLAAPFSEWMMGFPPGHITGVEGITRSNQLKIIGNGVVPQQAASALRQLLGIYAEEVKGAAPDELLLPTPMAHQSGCSPEDSIKNKPPGRSQITDLSILVSSPELLETGGRLLPTPLSGDGRHGSPNQADSSGNPSLPSAVLQSQAIVTLPTPVASDAADSARHTTTTGRSHSGTSLTDAIRTLPNQEEEALMAKIITQVGVVGEALKGMTAQQTEVLIESNPALLMAVVDLLDLCSGAQPD